MHEDTHHRIAACLEMEVGRPAVDSDFQEVVDVHALLYRPFAVPDVAAAGVFTDCSQPCASGTSPLTIWKNRCWIASVTGPRRPRPTFTRSTDRMGVTSTAVPTKNTSSAMYSISRGSVSSRTVKPRS